MHRTRKYRAFIRAQTLTNSFWYSTFISQPYEWKCCSQTKNRSMQAVAVNLNKLIKVTIESIIIWQFQLVQAQLSTSISSLQFSTVMYSSSITLYMCIQIGPQHNVCRTKIRAGNYLKHTHSLYVKANRIGTCVISKT